MNLNYNHWKIKFSGSSSSSSSLPVVSLRVSLPAVPLSLPCLTAPFLAVSLLAVSHSLAPCLVSPLSLSLPCLTARLLALSLLCLSPCPVSQPGSLPCLSSVSLLAVSHSPAPCCVSARRVQWPSMPDWARGAR